MKKTYYIAYCYYANLTASNKQIEFIGGNKADAEKRLKEIKKESNVNNRHFAYIDSFFNSDGYWGSSGWEIVNKIELMEVK